MFFDTAIQNKFYQYQNNSFVIFIASLLTTLFGDTGGIIFGAICAAFLYFVFKEKNAAIWLLSAELVGVGLNEVIKKLVGRVRPDTHRVAAYIHDSGASFASGHVTFTTIFCGVLFLTFFYRMKNHTIKSILLIVSILLILMVMSSRIILGVHYPSDTIGGVLLGLATVMFTYPTYVKLNNKQNRKSYISRG